MPVTNRPVANNGRTRWARLNTDRFPWELRIDIHVRYYFEEFEGESYWDGGEGNRRDLWRQNFESSVRRTWSHRWLMEAPSDLSGFCQDMTERGYGPYMRREWDSCHIPRLTTCILRIRHRTTAPPGGITHHRVYVYRANEQGILTGFFARHQDPLLNNAFVLVERDVVPSRNPDGNIQLGGAHEVGHCLGLDHPGNSSDQCRRDRQTRADPRIEPQSCYGDASTIMGTGMHVSTSDYEPFEEMMDQMGTGWRDWEATTRRPWGRSQPEPSLNAHASGVNPHAVQRRPA